MADKVPEEEVPKVTIRNVTRSSLSIHVPGECVRLQPGQTAQVHEAYLDTAELRTLCRQGAVVSMAAPATTRTDAEAEGSTGGERETARRTGPRRR